MKNGGGFHPNGHEVAHSFPPLEELSFGGTEWRPKLARHLVDGLTSLLRSFVLWVCV